MEMNMGKFSEKLVELLELAKKKKNVLEYQEISDFFKAQPLDAEQMDKIFDFLEASGMKLWQVLPMGPTGYGESPYQSFSVHAGNPMLISTEKLVADGLLTLDPGEEFVPTQDERVEFDQVRENKEKLLRKAFHQSEKGLLPEIRQFLRDERWVSDFALFTAVKQHFGGVMWRQWPDEGIKMRRKESLLQYRMMLDEDVRYHVFCQFIFFRQWKEFKAYCNSKGIELFGDMPIYVAEDSADTWTQPEVFQLDKNRAPKRVAGVPPDYFSADGQMWGNPLYRWEAHRATGYQWWITRLWYCFELYDVVRIDHFRGFDEYFSIPYGSETAASGHWEKGPGIELFRAVEQALGKREIIAEDLGYMSDTVRKLVRDSGFPGMKVLEFAFDSRDTGSASDYLPHNYSVNSVAYTGTHDNETLVSWYQTITAAERAMVRDYLYDYATPEEQLYKSMIALVLRSAAATCIIPMQDWLGLDNSARINKPSTVGENWRWRLKKTQLTKKLQKEICRMTTRYGRMNWE